jgi:hypothetical protein
MKKKSKLPCLSYPPIQVGQVLVNAVTVEVGPGTHVSDFLTNRELESIVDV